MSEPLPDPDEARALSMGAVAFLRLSRSDLAAAVEGHLADRIVGNVVPFMGVRRCRDPEPAPLSFEDQRWAERHAPDGR